MSARLAFACLILLFVSHVGLTAQKEWTVFALPPKTIDTTQEVKTLPQGWVASTEPVVSRMAGVTVFDGRPEGRASLVPDNEDQTRGRNTLVAYVWRLSPSSTGGTWLAFSYSETSVVLAKPLPQGTTEVRVTYRTPANVGGQDQLVSVEYR